MSKQQIAKLFDAKTLAAVEFLAAEDTDTVLAIWLRMLTLATNDPEGCVRLTPGLHMEPAALAEYFHCTPEALEVTLQILEQLQQLIRTPDGTLKLTACAGLCRRGKTKKSAAVFDATDITTTGSNNVTTSAATEKETEKGKRKEPKEKTKENNKKADIAAAISNSARRLIPIDQLPDPVPKILHAWNSLPLDNKFDGLYPNLLKQLQGLLKRYGEAALLKALNNVAHSNFLLGKSKNNRGWCITFSWLLNPQHLENILQGKYQDKKPRGESLLFRPGDEEEPYRNGFYGTVVN